MWRISAGAGAVLLALLAPAHADVVSKAPAAQPAAVPWLLGDWNGARTRLLDYGVELQFGYVNEAAYNAQGGTRREAAYADQYTAGATLSLHHLIGLPNAVLQVSFTQRTGRNLAADADLGTLELVQEVYGRGQTTRLTQLWFGQKYLDGALDWKIGRMGVGADFAAFSCSFQNLTFCGSNPGNIVGNYIYNWPISQWATRIKLAPTEYGYIQVGAYDVNPQYLGLYQALLPVAFPGSTGVLVPVEWAWLPSFGNGTLPGSYKVGAWYDTSTAADVVLDINGNPAQLTGLPLLQRRGRYGAYINFEQQVTRNSSPNPKGGLSLFLNAVTADRTTATLDTQVAGGLVYTGPLSWRPDDDVAFAVGMTHVNSRVAAVESLQNALGRGPVAVQDAEYVFELYYTVRPVNGLLLRPNIQYVHTPGGTSQNKDVIVLGLKSVANF
jgi:porin